MNKTAKVVLLFVMLLAVVLLVPSFCNAADITNESELEKAIQDAEVGSTITLTQSIEVSKHIDVSKNLTINGAGFSISGSDTWYNAEKAQLGGDQAILTSTAGTLTLKNITLKHGPKQGAQAYGNGALVLDDVTIEDCKYSALIANGGTITIQKANLKTKYGIEVGKSATQNEKDTPTIIMDGTIKSSSDVILYMASDTPSSLEVKNTETSEDKMYAYGNSVVVTDKNDNVLYEGAPLPLSADKKITVTEGESEVAEVYVVTIGYNGKTKTITVKKGETLPDLSDVKNAVQGKEFVRFVVAKTGSEFDETTAITSDLSLVAEYKTIELPDEQPGDEELPADEENATNDKEKDDTPKTGLNSYVGIVSGVLVISLASIIAMKKREE